MNSTDVVAGTNGTATQYNNLRSDVVLGLNQTGVDADAATITIDLSDKTKGKIRTITLGGNRTLAISNATVGQSFVLRLVQDGTGSRIITWFSTIKWDNNNVPLLTTTINKIDVFGFLVTSAGNYDGFILGLNK